MLPTVDTSTSSTRTTGFWGLKTLDARRVTRLQWEPVVCPAPEQVLAKRLAYGFLSQVLIYLDPIGFKTKTKTHWRHDYDFIRNLQALKAAVANGEKKQEATPQALQKIWGNFSAFSSFPAVTVTSPSRAPTSGITIFSQDHDKKSNKGSFWHSPGKKFPRYKMNLTFIIK